MSPALSKTAELGKMYALAEANTYLFTLYRLGSLVQIFISFMNFRY